MKRPKGIKVMHSFYALFQLQNAVDVLITSKLVILKKKKISISWSFPLDRINRGQKYTSMFLLFWFRARLQSMISTNTAKFGKINIFPSFCIGNHSVFELSLGGFAVQFVLHGSIVYFLFTKMAYFCINLWIFIQLASKSRLCT